MSTAPHRSRPRAPEDRRMAADRRRGHGRAHRARDIAQHPPRLRHGQPPAPRLGSRVDENQATSRAATIKPPEPPTGGTVVFHDHAKELSIAVKLEIQSIV